MKIIEIKKININFEALYCVSLEESAYSLTKGPGGFYVEANGRPLYSNYKILQIIKS